MKLRADHGVLRHDRRDRPAIISARDHVVLVRGVQMIRVHEISVAALIAQRQPFQHRMLAHQIERVPAHMRDFQILVARRDLFDVAQNPV